MLGGFLVLRWLDGKWWGVVLWILLSPVLYLLLDSLLLRRARQATTADAKRARSVKHGKGAPAGAPHAAPPAAVDWRSAQDVSTGGEILRRGRRYDHRI